MSTATSTDIEVLEAIHNQAPVACEIGIAVINPKTGAVLRYGDICERPAEWFAMLHSIKTHEDQPTHMCRQCYSEFLTEVCPTPACSMPRLSSARPI